MYITFFKYKTFFFKEFSANNLNANDIQKGTVGRSRSTGPETASMTGKQIGTAKMKAMNR